MLRFDGLAAKGQVQVAVFDTPQAWKLHKRPVRSATVRVTTASASVRFEGLPPGVYGVMAFHDLNANGRLDTLPIGLPTEPYGFSNNARGTFGPPAWSAARFETRPGQTTAQSIRLK